jgi:hypothetical protein
LNGLDKSTAFTSAGRSIEVGYGEILDTLDKFNALLPGWISSGKDYS